jgi:hypothetical protein
MFRVGDGASRAAWLAAGSPGPAGTDGRCSCCGTAGPALAARDVLSANFGDWDRMPWRSTGQLCPACAWVFGTRAWRLYAHVVTARPALDRVAPSRLYALLAAGPLPPTVAVSVPVGGKRHVAPWMAWGQIVSDHGPVTWAAADAGRLAHLRVLRGRGYGETVLTLPAPPWPLLRRDPDRADTMARWPEIDAWRAYPPALDVALRATRKDKET